MALRTGIVNVFSRSPSTIAQAIATLNDHANGRARLGLGVAHPGVVSELHGMPFDRPIERKAEYVRLVCHYLDGSVPDDRTWESFDLERLALWDNFETDPSSIPIYNAAIGPTNVQLTGHLADGWLPDMLPLSRLETALSWLAEGAECGDRSLDDVKVGLYVVAVADNDPTVARRTAAGHLAHYLREVPGYYDRVAADAGYEETVEAIQSAPSTAVATDRVDDVLVDELAVTGTPNDISTRVADLRSKGIGVPIVRVPITADKEQAASTLEACAPKG